MLRQPLRQYIKEQEADYGQHFNSTIMNHKPQLFLIASEIGEPDWTRIKYEEQIKYEIIDIEILAQLNEMGLNGWRLVMIDAHDGLDKEVIIKYRREIKS